MDPAAALERTAARRARRVRSPRGCVRCLGKRTSPPLGQEPQRHAKRNAMRRRDVVLSVSISSN
eukprot:5602209-Prymnesium_polylepis.1